MLVGMIPLVAAALVAALTGPIYDEPPDPRYNPAYAPHPLCEELREADDPYLTDATLRLCEQIVPFFRTREDRIHAVGVVNGESRGDCLANDRRWGHLKGGRPEGCWSFMTHLRWPQRYLGRLWGDSIDVYDIIEASWMASILVYDRPSSHLGFHHWWSVHRGALNRFLVRWDVRPVWYCPPAPYWKNVPAGSNRVCGGRTY